MQIVEKFRVSSWWEVLGYINWMAYVFLRATVFAVVFIVTLHYISVNLPVGIYVRWLFALYIILFIAMDLVRLLFIEYRNHVPKFKKKKVEQ